MKVLELEKAEEIVRERTGMTSNYAAAYAGRDVDVDVIAVYPITPQTTIVEKLSEFKANGEISGEIIHVESEHSALSAAVGASAVGARTFTATCSQGLELMHEVLHIASGLRLPIVMAVTGRALSAPISIHCDYSDVMNARDTGWIILIASKAQEVYDTIIQAYRIAEDERVLLPVMVAYDGFLMSHTIEPVELYREELVRRFTPRRNNRPTLDPEKPITLGPLATPEWYYEIRYQVVHALENAKTVVEEVQRDFNKMFKRDYDVVEEYRVEDAEYVLLTYGGISGNAKEAVDLARGEGIRAGLIRIRMYRPFPTERVVKSLERARAFAVLDRAIAYGSPLEGPLFKDVATALYSYGLDVPGISVIHGIGQRTVYVRDVVEIFRYLRKVERRGVHVKTIYMGLRA